MPRPLHSSGSYHNTVPALSNMRLDHIVEMDHTVKQNHIVKMDHSVKMDSAILLDNTAFMEQVSAKMDYTSNGSHCRDRCCYRSYCKMDHAVAMDVVISMDHNYGFYGTSLLESRS